MAEIGNVTVNVKVGIEPTEEFDAAARALGYVKDRRCRNDSTKRGKGVFLCSECGIHLDMAEMDEENLDAFYEPNFCPNCGALVEGADR